MKFRILTISIILICLTSAKVLGTNYIDSLKRIETTTRTDTIRFNALKKIAIAYSDSAYQKSLDYWHKAFDLARRSKSRPDMAYVYHQIGFMYLKKGEFPLALQELENALAVYEFVGMKKEMGEVNNDLGLVYKSWGRYEQALVKYLNAQSIFEEISDDEGLAMTSNNIGQIYYYREDYQKSIEYFNRYLGVNQRLNNPRAVAGAANNIASAYLELNDYDRALDYYLRSLRIYDSLGIKFGMAILQDNIGTLYTKRGQYSDALLYHTNSLSIFKEIGSKPRISYVLMNIGLCYFNLNSNTKALNYLIESKKLAEELNQKENLKEIYYNLSNVYDAIQEFDKALFFYKRYAEVKDSLINIETTEKLATIEAQFDADRKSRELALIQTKLKQQKNMFWVFITIGIIFVLLASLLIRENIQKKKAITEIYKQTQRLNRAIQKILSQSVQSIQILKSRFTSVFIQPNDISENSNCSLWVRSSENFTAIFMGCFGNHNIDIELIKSNYYSWFTELFKDSSSIDYEHLTSAFAEKVSELKNFRKSENMPLYSLGCMIVDNKESNLYICGDIACWSLKENQIVKINGFEFIRDGKVSPIGLNLTDSVYLLAAMGAATNPLSTMLLEPFERALNASINNTFGERNQLLSSTLDFWKTSNSTNEETLLLSIKI